MNRFFRVASMTAACWLALTPPAFAQSRDEEARFQNAQQRLDAELANFRAEFDRYQQARARDSRGGYRGQGYGGRPDYNDQPSYNGGQHYEGPPPGYADDRDEGGYDPSRYYRNGPNYQPRTLAADDRVYRGSDGRYYCKRNDGTTGLILGAVGGGILGNVIDGGHSRAAGTLIGGALGALVGRSVDQSNSQIRCQ